MSTNRYKITADLLHYQCEFMQSTAFYDCLFGGYGSGKTFVLVHKLLQLSSLNRGMPGGLLVPTLKMFRRDVLPTFRQVLGSAGIWFRYNSTLAAIEIPLLEATIYVFHSEDDGESIRGPNLAYGGVNEVTLCSEPAFKAFLARIRLANAKLPQIAMSGTPEGFNWTYNMFVAEPRKDAAVFYGDMRLNKFVASQYADMLVNSYDDLMVQQYVEGKFVNTTHGAALRKFNRMKHVVEKVEYNPNLPVWVSMDFNVDPFAATLWNKYPESGRVWLKAYDEICIKGGDSYEMAQAIRDKTAGADQVVLFPDPAGNQRRTSAKDNITDIDILETCGFEDIRYNTKISVRESLIAANAFTAKNRIQIGRKCKETIKDFEQCIIKPGTQVLLKKDLQRTHWLDGYKNMIEHEWPILVGENPWQSFKVR